LLHYDPETGVFTWLVKRSRTALPGVVAGCLSTHGYWRIKINQRYWLAHRLVHLYMTGTFPEFEIDHIDRDPLNNRWSNLREATRSENLANMGMSKLNTSGAKGVHWSKLERKWKARISFNNKVICLGTFESFELAVEFRQLAADMLHGEFVRHA
jgi:hypothetical protein